MSWQPAEILDDALKLSYRTDANVDQILMATLISTLDGVVSALNAIRDNGTLYRLAGR